MNLKQHQGRFMILLMGFVSFTLMGFSMGIAGIYSLFMVLVLFPLLDKVRSLIRFVKADFERVWNQHDIDVLGADSS